MSSLKNSAKMVTKIAVKQCKKNNYKFTKRPITYQRYVLFSPNFHSNLYRITKCTFVLSSYILHIYLRIEDTLTITI